MAVLEINKDNFETEVLKSAVPVLVDFWAPWCGPCRMVGPIIDEIAEEIDGIKVAKVNVDKETDLSSKFGVMSIPTIMVFNNGEITAKASGAKSKADIMKMLV